MNNDRPTVILRDETMREGMQIESASIPVADKVRLIEALSRTGLKHLVIGSFASPKFTPQMAEVEEILGAFEATPGVSYYALAFNARGRDRLAEFGPKVQPGGAIPSLACHMDDTFVRRNYNRTRQDEVDAWPGIIEDAVATGATQAGVGLGAPWGGNFEGLTTADERHLELSRQCERWNDAGIKVVAASLFDPMSWCMPHLIEETLHDIVATWPSITSFRLHLHNARGMALPSIYAALRVLTSAHTLTLETTVGGIGGCPYCGNGRATGMAATEDVVHMLEGMGIPTGVDLARLIEVSWELERIIGRATPSFVAKAGPRPVGEELYDPNIPFIETLEQARHFAIGPSAYEDGLRPWRTPIPDSREQGVDGILKDDKRISL